MTRCTPAPACDSRGVLRRDILVPRLSGVPVQDGNAGRIQIRLYQLQKQQQKQQQQLIMYLHGGGFTVSHVDSAEYDSLCAKLARRGFTVASVEYRLAPEHPFPAAVVDAYDALLWCAGTRGNEPHASSSSSSSGGGGGGGGGSGGGIRIDGRSGIILAGDSAGGNLSAVLSQLVRDNRNSLLSPFTPPPHLRPNISALLLIYPSVDRLNKYESDKAFENGYIISQPIINFFNKNYKPAHLSTEQFVSDIRVSPGTATSLSNLPPTVVMVCDLDPLCDAGIAYFRRLLQCGVRASLVRCPSVHGSFTLQGVVPEASRAFDECLQRLQELQA